MMSEAVVDVESATSSAPITSSSATSDRWQFDTVRYKLVVNVYLVAAFCSFGILGNRSRYPRRMQQQQQRTLIAVRRPFLLLRTSSETCQRLHNDAVCKRSSNRRVFE